MYELYYARCSLRQLGMGAFCKIPTGVPQASLERPANASAGASLAADLIHDDSWRHSPGRCSASLKIATHYALPGH